MEQKLFHEQYEKIDVPQDEVLKAIKTGVNGAKIGRKSRKNKAIALSAAAAAGIFISSSFMFPSFSKVMADMPVVGYFYRDLVGENLAAQKLITKLNETASYKGIDVDITSAYYDGAVIGVTFDVKGKLKTEEDGRVMGFYEIFKGDENLGETKEIVYMEPTENGFTGKIQLSYPKTELPADTTFPLKFKSIGDKKGAWRFDVPIKQLPFEIKTVDKESVKDGYKVHVDKIITGKASTAVNYTLTMPDKEKNDHVYLEYFDNNGNSIHWLSDARLEKKKDGDQIIIKGRTTFPEKLIDKTNYVEVRPAIALTEDYQFVTLNEKTPIDIRSPRQDLSVLIENISVTKKKFTVDFQVNQGDKKRLYFTDYGNFARNDITLVKESRKNIYEEPIKHTVETLDRKKLRFRSTFQLNDNFTPEKFVLRIDLDNLAVNMPHEMESVKINLK
ncbi:DUF4179 domain-containing protein [Neobacillus mesonae]|uniref:DUF4179 domain-containing protein n=1 Tax=Neobacillus mesonae TaxID=1193713 RepID=UPI0025736849|nr:DUF4179 domain-containing protein [Neobacillus mesonae]